MNTKMLVAVELAQRITQNILKTEELLRNFTLGYNKLLFYNVLIILKTGNSALCFLEPSCLCGNLPESPRRHKGTKVHEESSFNQNKSKKWGNSSLKTLLIVIIGIYFGEVYAQSNTLQLKNYSLEDGLSQTTVYAFLKDDLGYIWIGTRDGLNRFDGKTFVTFYPSFNESNSLSNRSIRALVQDKEGNIWVGTDGGGVDRLDPRASKFTKLCELTVSKPCELETNITSLEVSGNNLFIGTRNSGFFNYDITSQILTEKAAVPSTIWDIEVKNDLIVLATANGVFLIDSVKTRHFLKGQDVKALKFLNKEKILIGTKEQGVLILGHNADELTSLNDSLTSFEVSSIEIDNEGTIWVATDTDGIFIIGPDGKIISQLEADDQKPHQLQNNSIRTVFEDSDKIMWIGTNNSGFGNYFKYRYQFTGYSNETTKGELSSNVILSFNELNNGKVLIGTEQNGLILFDPAKESFSNIETFNNENIIAIEKVDDNQIWIATDGFGLKKIESQTALNSVKKIQGLTNESVLSLEETGTGVILAGLYRGFNIIKDDRVLDMSFIPSYLQQDRILAIESLGNDQFLLGTFANGLVYFNGATLSFTRFYSTNKERAADNRVPERIQSIYTDSKKRIWLGTYTGLVLFDPETEEFMTYTMKDGLPSDVVYGILEDSNHSLWLSTNFGISKFDPEKMNFINYSVSDGLPSNGFNGGAYFKNSNGKMYFGGVKGFIQFDPIDIHESYLPGKIIVHTMHVDGEIINTLIKNDITFNERQDFIQFDFSYLNFVNPEKYKLEYKLAGLSENWIPIRNRRSVNLSGLSPGQYMFEIRALSNIKEVTSVSEGVSFYIKPPLWKTWYFSVLMLLLLAGIMYALFRYRMFYLLKEEETRNRIARDLHDDLSATLSSISFFSAAAKRENQPSEVNAKFLQRIDESALEAKEKINDIIWAIDPENDDWNNFLTKCKRYASEMMETKDIEYELNIENNLNLDMNLEFRQNLWLVFKEMINNLVRHSGAKKASVNLYMSSGNLVLEVLDNGKGIDEQGWKTGNGLKNIKYRTERLKGSLVLENQDRKGVFWKLSIPV